MYGWWCDDDDGQGEQTVSCNAGVILRHFDSHGKEDTQRYCGLENVSIGATHFDCTQNIFLKNG